MKKKDIATIRDALSLGAHVFKEFLMHDDWDLDKDTKSVVKTVNNFKLFNRAQALLNQIESETEFDE